MIEFCTKLNCLRPPNYWSYIGLVPNVYGDLEALQSKILELFLFFGGVGSVGNKSWGFRTGKVTVEIFTKCIISRLGFFIQLGIVMGWDGFQFNLLVFRCMIGTRLKALM